MSTTRTWTLLTASAVLAVFGTLLDLLATVDSGHRSPLLTLITGAAVPLMLLLLMSRRGRWTRTYWVSYLAWQLWAATEAVQAGSAPLAAALAGSAAVVVPTGKLLIARIDGAVAQPVRAGDS